MFLILGNNTVIRRGQPITEDSMISFFLSVALIQPMIRCFGKNSISQFDTDTQSTIISMLHKDEDVVLQPSETLLNLVKFGIFEMNEQSNSFKFSSPLSKRFFMYHFYGIRCLSNPPTIVELIKRVIGSMSSSMIRQSLAKPGDFPKEATFQHMFMSGLASNTTFNSYICPELSKVFPLSEGETVKRISGEIDFFIDGDLRWGVELLIQGSDISEHINRFEVNGKYAALDMKDYIVVDLRGNESGIPTNVQLHSKRFTAFFKQDDYSVCNCVNGMDNTSFEIQLQH